MANDNKSGFSLVELLVVIAIISILAGLLLPALEDAIDSARQAQCMNQQKQASCFLSFYADDHSGWYPRSRSNEIPSGVYSSTGAMKYAGPWGLVLAFSGYLDYSGDVYGGYEETATLLEEGGLLNCPSIEPVPASETLHQWLQTFGMRTLACKTWSDWSGLTPPSRINVNSCVNGAYPPQSGASSYPVGSDSSKQHPGSKWWNDGAMYYEEAADLSYRATFSYEGVSYRTHKDRGNVWFLDGHVVSLDKFGYDDLIDSPGDGDLNRNWNDDSFENSWYCEY